MPRVVHFEIHVADPDRAIAFYRQLFDWEFHKWDGPSEYWLIRTGPDEQPGINGGMLRRKAPAGGDSIIAYIATIDVPAIDEYVARATAAGGKLCLPKMPVPGVGWLAYCADTEGNVFGMMQMDPTAA